MMDDQLLLNRSSPNLADKECIMNQWRMMDERFKVSPPPTPALIIRFVKEDTFLTVLISVTNDRLFTCFIIYTTDI